MSQGLADVEPLVTAEQLGAALALKATTIRKWARQGKLPCVRLAPLVMRFRVAEVWKAIEKLNDAKEGGEDGSGTATE